MELKALLAQPNALPSAPEAVLELMKTFDNDNAGLHDIVNAIEADPVIVAKLLRLANSPFFFRGHVVESTFDAVRLLGQSKVRSLVIGLIARDSFPALSEAALQQFWRFSLNTADVARHIASVSSGDEDAAYTGGLLHMIGELVMRIGMPVEMQKLDEKVAPLAMGRGKSEIEVFGYSYAEVGTELGKQWQLPERIIRIVSKQRNPNLADANDFNAVIVQLASWRARAIELNLPEDTQIRLYPVNAGKALGIDPAAVVGWMPATAAA